MGIYRRVLWVLLCVLLGTQGHAMARHIQGHKQHKAHHQAPLETQKTGPHPALMVSLADTDHSANKPGDKPLGKCVTGAQVYNLGPEVSAWSAPPAFATPHASLPHTLALSHPVPKKPPRQMS